MATALAATTVLYVNPAVAAQNAEITVAYHPNLHGGAPMAIAQAQGLFDKEGLKVNPVRFTSGAPELDAMIAGQLDIGYLGPGALPAVMRGEVALLTVDHPSATEYVLASQRSGVRSPADLKGRQVLVALGTSGELVLREALKTAGLSWNDITPVNSPDESSLTAYTSGAADVISVGPTFTAQARAQTPSTTVFDSSNSPDFALPGVWIANKEFVTANRDLVDRFLRAFGVANDYRLAHQDEVVGLTARYTGTPEADLRAQLNLTQWWTTEQALRAISSGEVESMLAGLNRRFQETGKMTKLAAVTDYFDGQATVTAYQRVSQGTAQRVDDSGFPWVFVMIGVFLVLLLAGIGVIIRRARS
ncbi:ABC transporter substrate-binding protein [Amycolatopsis sp. TRM77291]